MITIYPESKYNKGFHFIANKIQPGLIYHSGSLEEVPSMIKDNEQLIIDFRYLNDKINESVNYTSPDEIGLIYQYIKDIDNLFLSANKDLLYYFILPDSEVNMSRYIVSSVISNLNLFHRIGLKSQIDGTYQINNKFIKYKFNIFNNELIQEIKRKSL